MAFWTRKKTDGVKVKSHRNSFLSRFYIIIFLIFVFVVLIIFQMFRWQVLSHERLAELAESMHVNETDKPQIRGSIYASDGSVLAYDVPGYDLIISLGSDKIDLEKFESQKVAMLTDLAKLLNTDKEQYLAKIKDAKKLSYLPLEYGLSLEQKRILQEKKYIGLVFKPVSLRKYPNGSLAAHVLGFVGKDEKGESKGRYGIEGFYSDDLVGKEGVSRVESDITGTVSLDGAYQSIEAQQGKDIVLTIDTNIQSKVENILKAGVEEYSADSGSVIVMNPKTGAILAMANYPTFDPNNYSKVRGVSIYLNKSIADAIESGSVFKPLTIASGLDSKAVDKNYTCNDDKGYLEIGERKIHTWDRKPDGIQTLGQILANSNNVCAARVGLAVGKQGLFNYFTKFGIGQHIGINMQGEGNNFIKSPETWGRADNAVASFGQMVTATNLQLISAASALANDGKRMQPYIVSEVRGNDSSQKFVPYVAAQVVDKDVANTVMELMRFSVEHGESKSIFAKKKINTYKIAGKTGTALIVDSKTGLYYEGATNTLFVGAAPSDNPKFIMLLRLEKPKNNTLSAYNVLPLWADLFLAIKDDLGITN